MSILTALFIASSFALWPVIGKYSGAGGAWVGTLVLFITWIPIAVLSRAELIGGFPSLRAMLILAVAGVINGVGCYVFAQKTSSIEINTAVFMVLVSIFMVVMAPVFSWVFNGEVLEQRHYAGFACAVLAVYLLRA